MALSFVAVGAWLGALVSGMELVRQTDPGSAAAATLEGIAGNLRSASWSMALLAIGALATVSMLLRMLYRVHRCELLLRWSGIDENRFLAGSSCAPHPERGPAN
jgi:hypothetical protein